MPGESRPAQQKVSDYQAELRAYYGNPSAYPHLKYPPPDLSIKTRIAHYQDLSKRWNSLAAEMNRKAAKLDAASMPK